MVKKGFLSVRLDDETMSELDEIAKKRLQSRSEAIRALIHESSSDPYQVLQYASQGTFRSEYLHYLVSLCDIEDSANPIAFELDQLREWLLGNPYNPEARDLVLAVVAHSSLPHLPEGLGDQERLREIAKEESARELYQKFQSWYARRIFHKPEEGIEDDR